MRPAGGCGSGPGAVHEKWSHIFPDGRAAGPPQAPPSKAAPCKCGLFAEDSRIADRRSASAVTTTKHPTLARMIEFLDPGGAVTGTLLPTGNVRDLLEVEGEGSGPASLVDAASPFLFVDACGAGITGTEKPAALDARPESMERLQRVRAAAAVAIGIADSARKAPFASTRLSPILPDPEQFRILRRNRRGLHLERVRDPNHQARRPRRDHRRRWPSPVSSPAQGLRGNIPDWCHWLVVAGTCASPEPARIARGLEHPGQGRIARRIGIDERGRIGRIHEERRHARRDVFGHQRIRHGAVAHLRRRIRRELPAHIRRLSPWSHSGALTWFPALSPASRG